jgi:hypothetical protein
MASKIKIVLFEDTEQTRLEILRALKRRLKRGSVIPFEGKRFKESAADKQRTFEDRLEKILGKQPYEPATLLVIDRDLSKGHDYGFGGLSDSAVIGAAKRLGMPACLYARQQPPEDYEWRGRWGEAPIFLRSENEDELARQAVLAAHGFAQIAAKSPKVLRNRRNNSPAKILAALLGKPEYSEKIALYGVGDQDRMSEIPRRATDPKKLRREVACFLGYWVWNSLLRYPGVLVNEIAAASYLNVHTRDFRAPKVQAVFKEALYRGPFADPKRPQWWRGKLDDIVARGNCADGLQLVRRKASRKARASRCYVDLSRPAGYYCIISRQPVSLENSRGGLSWFPRGADLTRISKPKFDELAPWLAS